jgi:homoserine dehydrogenase
VIEFKIGLIGKGVVGTCFLQLLNEMKKELEVKHKALCKVVAVFKSDGALIEKDGLDLDELVRNFNSLKESNLWIRDAKAIDYISKLDLNICIDATPTNSKNGEPALQHVIEALNSGIDVISSNKAPFYLEHKKIRDLAEQNRRFVCYEATVGSSIPILSIKNYLMGISIVGIKAILNGTNNYILSRMTSEGISFSVALKEAQELGYAESDPSLDIEGYDAAGKLVIVANDLLEQSYKIRDVQIEGISKITPQAIELAKSDGYVIKHLAIVEDNGIVVEPRLIKKDSPLNVSGTTNIIEIETKHIGSLFLMGNGAGGYEAASAILNDMLYIIKERQKILLEEVS